MLFCPTQALSHGGHIKSWWTLKRSKLVIYQDFFSVWGKKTTTATVKQLQSMNNDTNSNNVF